MKILFFLFIFCFLGLYNPSMAQILEQNFDGLGNIEEFKADDPNDPDVGQVERINLEVPVGGEPIFSLAFDDDDDDGKYLQIHKQGNKMRHFLRVKEVYNEDFNFLKISFSFSLDEFVPETEEKKFAVFFTGGNLNDNSRAPDNDQRWGQVSINVKRNGSYFLATEEYDETENENNVIIDRTGDYSNKKHITIVMNNTEQMVEYTGPGGGEAEIDHQMVDVWVEEDRVISNSRAYVRNETDIQAVKFLVWNNSLTATASLDNLVISNDQGFDPLPVVLTTFTATKSGDDVVLDWETASEMNSSHFEVERSLNGEQFEKIGTVSAAGNTNISQNYSFPDKQAGLRFAGTLYYRLHQVDTDGASEYSPVSRVELPAPASAFRRVYPNPFEGDLNVGLITDKSMEVTFRLLNLQGTTLVKDVKITEPAGQEQVFRFTGTESLQAGMYILEIASAGEKKRYRIVKL